MAESVAVVPPGFVMVTVTAAPEAGSEPFSTETVMVAERVFPPVLTTADAETVNDATTVGATTLADPAAPAVNPLVPSDADAVKAFDPDAVLGEVNGSVVDALAPGASDDTDAGLNDDGHPL